MSPRVRVALGYFLALAGLAWVLHDVHPGELVRSLRSIQWAWVAPAILFDVLSYVCQGVRWKLLLRPIGALSVLRTTQAIYVGLFTNELFPLRFGEIVRAYLVSRWLSTDFVSVIPSMALERLFDAVWLAAGMGLTAIFVPLPRDLADAGDVLGLVVLIATGLFVLLVLRKPGPGPGDAQGSAGPRQGVLASHAGAMAAGLRTIGASPELYLSFVVSLFLLGFQALAFWLIMIACGLELSFWVGAAVLLIVHLGTAIPNAPANVGSYQFFCVVGLTLFGAGKTEATGFSLVVFVLLTLPLWALGFLALSHSGTTLYEIRNEIKRLKYRES